LVGIVDNTYFRFVIESQHRTVKTFTGISTK